MGSYGIGTGRLMAVIVELHHDEAGIQWPITVAPYQVMLISLATEKTPEVAEAAEKLYADLLAAGVEVLYDDRDERAGVKFNDADLLGIPIRLTVGAKGLQNGVIEGRLRRNGETFAFSVETVVQDVQALIAAEIERIYATVVPVPFDE
jgi:prolyl-tRNA synthetase